MELEGNILVMNGGHLRITAPRFMIRGNIRIEGGAVDIEGGVLVVNQRFNHQFGILAVKKSQIKIKDSAIFSYFPMGLFLRGNSSLEVEDANFTGGLTCEAPDTCRITLKKAMTPGEFLVAPGASLSVIDSDGLIIWSTLDEHAKGTVSFPGGESVSEWSSRNGLDVHVKNSRNVLWAILSTRGSDCSTDGSHLRAAGLRFNGTSRVRLKDLRNRADISRYTLDVSDRKLRFEKTRVDTWNIYGEENAVIRVSDCLFGESMAAGTSSIEICDSTCDGSGGYVGSDNGSKMRLSNCKITCLVIARENSRMTLENCDITGDVIAVGNAVIELRGCNAKGNMRNDPGAKIIKVAK